jgi:PAS domain S-box-containing protein
MPGTMIESEDLFRRLYSQSPVGAVIVATDFRFLRCNEAFCRFSGYAEVELCAGRSFLDITLPEDRDKGVDEIRGILGGEKHVARVEKRYVRKDGAVVWGRVNIRLVRARDGTALLSAIVEDITTRKAQEEALRESEERYHAMFEQAGDGVFILDTRGEVISVNAKFAEMHGLSVEEVKEKGIAGLDVEGAGPVPERARRILAGETLQFEVEHYHRDGHIFPLSVTAKLIAWGGRQAILAVHRDITERKRAEIALRESEAHVQRKLQSILSPSEGTEGLDLEDMIDVRAIQELMDEFYRLTNVPNAIIDLKGKVLVGTGWQDICTQFHRRHPETLRNCIECDTVLSRGVEPGTFKTYLCKNNLWDCVTPLIIGGRHVGNLFTGQFFFRGEKPDDSVFRAQAARYGFDERSYMAAVARVPTWDREKIAVAFAFYARLSNLITSLSHSSMTLARALEARRAAEEALRERERVLAKAQEIAHTGSWELDIATLELTWSEEVFRIFGHAPGAFRPTMEAFQQGVHPEDRGALHAAITSAWQSLSPFSYEHRILRPGGEVRVVHEQAEVERDASGRAVRWVGTVQDITERKGAEEALRESETRFRSLVEAAPVGAFVQSGGRFVFANAAVAALLGAGGPEDLVGTECFDRIAPEYHAAVRERIRRQVETGAVAPPMEQEYLRLDGARVPVETTAVPVKYQGRDAHLVLVRDMTEHKREEAERAQLQGQLQQAQKMESIGRLAGGVAHDFNNMLGVILGHVDLAMDRLDPGHVARADLAQIRRAAERSADLTRQLLAFARKQAVAPRSADLNAVVGGVLTMLERLIGEQIALEWRPGAGLWTTRVDPAQIDQVLANLCVNARDAISGTGRIEIETANSVLGAEFVARHPGAVAGDYVRLSVRDSGCGMDAATLERLFEPFFTTKPVGAGTGLGLAMVYGVVKQNNGFIEVASHPGKGTTFAIYLPRYGGQSEAVRPEAAAPRGTPGRETVLVVEDEPTILDLAQTVLEMHGYTVLKAGTPAEGLRVAREHGGEIHLLLTDVVMPGMNGRDLACEVQALHPQVRLLFMSGYTADVIAHHGVLNAGVRFIEKPFSARQLAQQVREALGG